MPSTHESVQRQALGLANSHDNGLFVGVQQLHTTVSAAQLVATPEARLNNQTRQPINGTVRVQQARTAPTCDNNFQLDVLSANNDSLVLDWQAGNCPTVNQLANANQWSLGPVPVRLQMQPHPSAGTPSSKVRVGWVWVSHAWGGIPNQGAVVLDQLRLILDTQTNQPFSISANRSKRRSGRGPKQVLATIRGRDWQDQSLDMQWIDEGPLVPPSSGVTYPDQFRLLNESRGLNVLLTPLVSPPNINGSSAPRWNGAVVVSGSHQGVGFVSFEPVGRSLPSIDVVSNK